MRSPDAMRRALRVPARATSRSSARHLVATPFGARLRDIVSNGSADGLVVLGPGPSRWRRMPTAEPSWPRPGRTIGGARQQSLLGRRHLADRDTPRDPGPAGRQRAAALARGGRGLQVGICAAAGGLASTSRPAGPCSSDPGDEAPRDVGLVTAAWRRSGPSRRTAGELLVAGRTSATTWRGSNGTPRPASARGWRSAGAASRAWHAARAPAANASPTAASSGSSSTRRARRLGAMLGPHVRCRDRRHAGPAGPPSRGRRGDLALRRGSLRLGPPAARTGRSIRGCGR